mmetsp:Transcript_425/g.1921  ORF Transcript_425/g.1921 Transcript_425/m.1921 type:complete len:237 (+) Transcript_425:288-998(+)
MAANRGQYSSSMAAEEDGTTSVEECTGRRWKVATFGDGAPANAYKCASPSVSSASGRLAVGLLHRFRRDPSLASPLASLFGVQVAGCTLAEGPNGNGLNVIVQNRTMRPDTFHPDLCDAPAGWARGRRGLTLLTYPHDVWHPDWRGHLELAGPSSRAVARLAPLPNRSILFDACIWHRATNPAAAAAPLLEGIAVAPPFAVPLGRMLPEGPLLLHQWRFAMVMQMRCPLLQTQVAG